MFSRGLQKIALNSLKAHQIAKELGVVPHGSWKWALRNARKGYSQGGLKGLAKAKEKMGALTNNQRQKLLSAERRFGSKGKAEAALNGSGEAAANTQEFANKSEYIRAHTHPTGRGQVEAKAFIKHPEIQAAMKSGDLHHDIPAAIHGKGPERVGISGKHLINPRVDIFAAARDHKLLSSVSGPLKPKHQSRLDWTDRALSNTNEADYGMLVQQHYRGHDHPHAIHSSALPVEGVHKLRPTRVRSSYFDRTPRKIK